MNGTNILANETAVWVALVAEMAAVAATAGVLATKNNNVIDFLRINMTLDLHLCLVERVF